MLATLIYEKPLTLLQDEVVVTFSASSTSAITEIYIATPIVGHLMKYNYTTYLSVTYSESAEDSTFAFQVAPAVAGDWTFGEISLNSNSLGLFALVTHQPPSITFDSVTPGSGLRINIKVSRTSADPGETGKSVQDKHPREQSAAEHSDLHQVRRFLSLIDDHPLAICWQHQDQERFHPQSLCFQRRGYDLQIRQPRRGRNGIHIEILRIGCYE